MLKLKLSMLGTLTLIIGLSTLFFTYLLSIIGVTNIIALASFIIIFNIAQWLFAPYLIDAMYRVKALSRSEAPELYRVLDRLCRKSGVKTPTLMISKIPIPNAFAYGSPLTGTRIAVTSELLNVLEPEEVEAVIGHEIGHLKHRDVQVMMFISILPALFYYIGYSMLWSAQFGRRDRENGGLAALIGLLSIALYWILTLFTLHLSRLREYYADRHSASVVEDGARKLSEGLVKIVHSTERVKRVHRVSNSFSSFKALFIADPDSSGRDLEDISRADLYRGDRSLVERYIKRKITVMDRIAELFSTHPNLIKRLRALQELQQ